ncbi:hypothetical protein CO010_00950 [Candidatus Shapirobacteria bacterium CG_4_8_14_3_um_filter_39_11]|uniref:Uncharacterized protein n=2 Tax=Candidatus Shapironibacteriota TaxID=1752721 RepID=A0A2M8EV20_9BACT|nr:MAG: hypothetical protein CO053_01845 [Candidatus Shapirobacteria bacterium CG_4_9_14_0_2_um_filter_40_11]PJC77142.1 MAG: hypothetical protein CO010_00950 [Candidatus Shapirobacteria bacterium CG_4_8_14_3_um_filter_39_11]
MGWIPTELKIAFWLIGVAVLGFGGLLFGGWLLVSKELILGSIVLLIALWILLSIKILRGDELGLLLFFGEPSSVKEEGGPQFVPFLIAKLIRYPKKMYSFLYLAKEVISKAGKYAPKPKKEIFEEGKHEDEEKEEEKEYGAQVLKVTSAVYLNFPREKEKLRDKEAGKVLLDEKGGEREEETHPLIKIFRAGVPIKDEDLKNWTEDIVVGAVRAYIGTITWREAAAGLQKVSEEVEKLFKAEGRPLYEAGFRDPGIKLVITEIALPQKLQEVLPLVDKERLESEAAPFEAKQQAEETGGAVMEMFCTLTGMKRKKIEKELEEKPEEFVTKYQKIWEKSWDIIHRRMGIDGGAYLDIRTANPLQDLLALFKRMPMGKPSGRKEEKEEKVEAKVEAKIEGKKEEELSEEEKQIVAEARKRGIGPKEPLEKWRRWKKRKEK